MRRLSVCEKRLSAGLAGLLLRDSEHPDCKQADQPIAVQSRFPLGQERSQQGLVFAGVRG